MIYGSMRHSPSGRRRKTNAWSTKKREFEFVPMEPNVVKTPVRGDTSHIPSNVSSGHSCGRDNAKVYTGTLVKGISTMHKSNAVPVISEEEMVEHARMRR